ncbi:unnamed protein product [Rodentolepis nana]|uniref:Acyltransferase n=1 Tax=Rodentolepis nana TaxID=102285 RepID=A0A0R3T8H6_RODNA|nr:unnamed protein product [Rodentolepis nana]
MDFIILKVCLFILPFLLIFHWSGTESIYLTKILGSKFGIVN